MRKFLILVSLFISLVILLLLGLGLLGFMMRRYNIPVAPVLIAVLLGPLTETELRHALIVFEGDPSILISSPFTLGIYGLLAIGLTASAIQHLRHHRMNKIAEAQEKEAAIPAAV